MIDVEAKESKQATRLIRIDKISSLFNSRVLGRWLVLVPCQETARGGPYCIIIGRFGPVLFLFFEMPACRSEGNATLCLLLFHYLVLGWLVVPTWNF